MFVFRFAVGVPCIALVVATSIVVASEPPRQPSTRSTRTPAVVRRAAPPRAVADSHGEATASDSPNTEAATTSDAAQIETTISDATASDGKALRPAVKRQSFGGKVDLASFTTASAAAVAKTAPLNLPTYTFGGTEVWGDELFYGKWRIQRNVLTNHCRLLDPDNLRHAWGTYEQCMARLKQLQTERHLSPVRGKVVIALHGLAAHRAMMTPLVEHLEKEGGFTVLNVTYPSTRGTIAQHAQRLAGIVEHLDEATEIDFVAHSMGNLVVRYYLQVAVENSEDGRIDPRIKRFVMLGPPNHGAHCAVALGGNPIFDNVMGEAAQQLGRRWGELAARLDTPPCDFAVIAGGLQNRIGWNPLLEGDDDGLVKVDEARLAGAADFALLDLHHVAMTFSATARDYTLRFLTEGRLRADGERQPIPREDAQQAKATSRSTMR